jgi:hypothetical protein
MSAVLFTVCTWFEFDNRISLVKNQMQGVGAFENPDFPLLYSESQNEDAIDLPAVHRPGFRDAIPVVILGAAPGPA